MLFPNDFWLYFALLVGGGMIATFALAALTSRLRPGSSRKAHKAGTGAGSAAEARQDASAADPREKDLAARVRSEQAERAAPTGEDAPVMTGAGAAR